MIILKIIKENKTQENNDVIKQASILQNQNDSLSVLSVKEEFDTMLNGPIEGGFNDKNKRIANLLNWSLNEAKTRSNGSIGLENSKGVTWQKVMKE